MKVPSHLSRLYRAYRKGEWTDGPEAITWIRNEPVHPTSRLTVNVGTFIAEAWSLAQWYIELFILKMANYSGVYSNRLRTRWRGEVEQVP